MYNIQGKEAKKIGTVTFSDLNMQEKDIEEILRLNIDMLCDEEESMLIIGQQVKNEMKGRSDLTAINNEGSIVLIEVKRDRKGIENRKESFEFQAIRYAASYATIESPEDLVKRIYAPYIEKHKDEFELGDRTAFEYGLRKLNNFLEINDSEKSFNIKQKIILAASDFDEQTLSAVAWLNSNSVDISCYKLIPYKINGEVYLGSEKLLPLMDYCDYYVDIIDQSSPVTSKKRTGIKRRSLPRIDALLEWGVVKAGDIIKAKDKDELGTLLKNGNIEVDGVEMSMQAWLKDLYGWSSIQTYVFAIHKETGKSLAQLREEYLEKQIEHGE